MHFLSWLLEQIDEPVPESRVAKIVYWDINNGCMNPLRSAAQVREHFYERHAAHAAEIVGSLDQAFKAYADSLGEN